MRKKNVLVVDDEPDQREIYRAVLSHAGYSVLEAGDALEGVRLAREASPDIILLDIALPGVDGWAAARMLKAEPATALIPICAISARYLPSDEDVSRRAGFACYLLKPVEPRRVLHEINIRIGPAGAPESKVLG